MKKEAHKEAIMSVLDRLMKWADEEQGTQLKARKAKKNAPPPPPEKVEEPKEGE